VKRLLLTSSSFAAAAKRLVKQHRQSFLDIQSALELLAIDAFHPRLKTHKLKGELQGLWACSAGYDLQIVFRFVQHEGTEAVLLESVGTHDEVY
jgi:mRNA-degrading endonuclease YafQ of YafQ-DinJ toxin-antitoxin module